jgi:ADP-heptose:LPS heptosyltransferase
MTAALEAPVTLVENRPVRDVAAILRRARLVVSNDTGIMHVAGAVGTPVLSLFGPTDARQWAPLNRGSRYIQAGGEEIAEIGVDRVLDEALSMLHEPLRTTGDE